MPGEDDLPGLEEGESDEGKSWVEMSESWACGCLENVDAVEVEVHLASLGHDTTDAVGEHMLGAKQGGRP